MTHTRVKTKANKVNFFCVSLFKKKISNTICFLCNKVLFEVYYVRNVSVIEIYTEQTSIVSKCLRSSFRKLTGWFPGNSFSVWKRLWSVWMSTRVSWTLPLSVKESIYSWRSSIGLLAAWIIMELEDPFSFTFFAWIWTNVKGNNPV